MIVHLNLTLKETITLGLSVDGDWKQDRPGEWSKEIEMMEDKQGQMTITVPGR